MPVMLPMANTQANLTLADYAGRIFTLHKVFYCASTFSDKSVKVICRFDGLRTAHSNS